MREVGRSLQGLAKLALDHVANRHRIYEGRLADDLRTLVGLLEAMSKSENGNPDISVFHANAQKALQALDRPKAFRSEVPNSTSPSFSSPANSSITMRSRR